MNREATVDNVVSALAAEGLLAPGAGDRSRAVIADCLLGKRVTPQRPAGPRLVEVVAYLGAALVLAAAVLFLVQSWDDLGDVGRVAFLGTIAAVLALAGVVTLRFAGQEAAAGDMLRRLSGTVLSGSAVATGFTVGVAIEAFAGKQLDGGSWPGVAGGLAAAAVASVGYRFSSTAVGLVTILAGVLSATANAASGMAGDEGIWVGSAFFTVALGWLLLTESGVFDQRTIARTAGVAVALMGAQVASFTEAESWVGYLMSTTVAAAGVWLYLTRLEWPYLGGAVLAVTLVVPEALSDWTNESLGVVGGVLVAGITLLVASYAGFRLRREAGPTSSPDGDRSQPRGR